MIEQEYKIPTEAKAALVSIISSKLEGHNNPKQTELSLHELEELMRTLNIETTGSYIQKKEDLDPATILGRGKLEEIAQKAKDDGSDLLVFDFELSPAQTRNIKKICKLEVLDRCNVILEIFAKHARTKDATLQVEISRLEYLLPRLSGMWTHFGKQRGGIGVRGGEGEQQIELDRRIIRNRIAKLKNELVDLKKSRIEQSKRRNKNVVTAALVGYTNAGKSSLMNRLCGVEILEENKLFATLDSTYRTLNPDSHPPMVLIDTVGFIQNLPSTLVNGFKTTLESAVEADLLIIVCDVSDENYEKHLEVTLSVLGELKIADKDKIIVFNKKDQCQDQLRPVMALKKHEPSFLVSTYDKEDMKNLRSYVINYFLSKQNVYDLFVAFEDGASHSKISANTNIEAQRHLQNGTFYRVRTPDFIFHQLGLEDKLLAPDDPIRDEINGIN